MPNYISNTAENHISEIYPYNVKPQYRAPDVEGKYPQLSNPPDYSSQAIIFKNNELVIVKGWDEKGTIKLNNLFVPINNFLQMELLVKPSNEMELTDYQTLDFSLLSSENKVNFICLIPSYENQENLDQTYWKIMYKFNNEDNWNKLGRILMLSHFDNTIEPLKLKNITEEDLYIKILLGVE